jgi:hypothetical protein
MTYHHLYFLGGKTLKYISKAFSYILQGSFEEEVICVVKSSIEVY